MSKLGKKIIQLPKDASIKIEGNTIIITGPKGTKKIVFNEKVFAPKVSDKNEFQLVDIRDEYEYDICCIGGEKINMYSIIDNLDKLSREKKVIIYCRTGSRSANIVNLLENSYSFQNVYNLEGGIMKWRDDIDPTIKEY